MFVRLFKFYEDDGWINNTLPEREKTWDVQHVQHLFMAVESTKMQLNLRWFSPLRPRLPYCCRIFAAKMHPNCTTV